MIFCSIVIFCCLIRLFLMQLLFCMLFQQLKMLYFFLSSDKLSKIVSNSSPVATGVQYINSTILHCSLNLQILLINRVFSFNYLGDLKFFMNNIKLSLQFFLFYAFLPGVGVKPFTWVFQQVLRIFNNHIISSFISFRISGKYLYWQKLGLYISKL